MFTAIVCAYQRLNMLQDAVNAIREQSYENLEIILINHGAIPIVREYLHEVETEDKRVQLLHFEKNVATNDDPAAYLDLCLNPALEMSTGDYIWVQSDDDYMDREYVQKMVALFEGNPNCITAAGIPVSVDMNGNLLKKGPRTNNFRPKYMAGHLLALDHLRGGNMFGAPGGIWTIKRDRLVSAGGFHRALETRHLYGIVPFGITGFDETAVFFWRRHKDQGNVVFNDLGRTGVDENINLLTEWDIELRWKQFGEDTANEVVSGIVNRHIRSTAIWFGYHLIRGRVAACRRILRDINSIGYRRDFWTKVPNGIWSRRRDLGDVLWLLPRMLVKRVLRCVFRLLPQHANIPSTLQRIRSRVNR